jgi:hypothetical protein
MCLKKDFDTFLMIEIAMKLVCENYLCILKAGIVVVIWIKTLATML